MVSTRTTAARIAAVGAAAALAGCGSSPHSAAPSAAETQRALRGSAPALAALHRQSGALLTASPDAFRARLRSLRGYPIVVNKWASWCGPCRSEFLFFQRLGVSLGKRVAFLGVDGNDNDPDARRFLERYPVPYPSYSDPELLIARVLEANLAFPTTVFYDARGHISFVHQGEYPSEAKLRQDIRRYTGI